MHPVVWFVWIGAAALVPLVTRDPFSLVIDFAITCVVVDAIRARPFADIAPAFASPLRFALFAVLVGALFNGLTSHVGETILLRLPDAIPLIGGPLTGESLIYGAINGLILATLFSAFAALTLAVPVRDLIAYLPRAFYPIAVVSAIAATFVPSSVRQFQQVREAQAIRGHRMRGLRDWLPLFMPVLIGGLERALQLAEAMTARGFAAGGGEPQSRSAEARRGSSTLSQVVLAVGLGAVLAGGVLRLLPGGAEWRGLDLSLPLLILGATATVWVVWRAGSQVHHTRYRRSTWTGVDVVCILSAVVAVLPLMIFTFRGGPGYSPYPRLALPTFDLRLGLPLLGLLAPIWGLQARQATTQRVEKPDRTGFTAEEGRKS